MMENEDLQDFYLSSIENNRSDSRFIFTLSNGVKSGPVDSSMNKYFIP
jgi:hypothetical protein